MPGHHGISLLQNTSVSSLDAAHLVVFGEMNVKGSSELSGGYINKNVKKMSHYAGGTNLELQNRDAGSTILFDVGTACTVTLPHATSAVLKQGMKFTFIWTADATAQQSIIATPDQQGYIGGLSIIAEAAPDESAAFTAHPSGKLDHIHVDGTETGGKIGSCIEIVCADVDLGVVNWIVSGTLIGADSVVFATPFAQNP